MNAALHGGYRNACGLSDHHLSSVTDGSGAWERRNFGVRNARCLVDEASESAEAGAENETDARAQRGPQKDLLGGGFGECKGFRHRSHHFFAGCGAAVANCFSNAAREDSSFHCSLARSLPARKRAHCGEAFSLTGSSPAHEEAARNSPLVCAHRLSPRRKLCSRLWRAMVFRSA